MNDLGSSKRIKNNAKEIMRSSLTSSLSSNESPRIRGRRSQLFNKGQNITSPPVTTTATAATASVPNLDPTSWIRSASTSSLRRLKKTHTDSTIKTNKHISSSSTVNNATTSKATVSASATNPCVSTETPGSSSTPATTTKNSDALSSPPRTASETEILMTKIHISRPKISSQPYSDPLLGNFWDPTNSKLIDHTANLGPEDDFVHSNPNSLKSQNFLHGNNTKPSTKESVKLDDPSHDVSRDIDEDIVVDVLPSFEMYNALHRHIPQGNVDPDIHELPPSYMEAANHNESMPNSYIRDMPVNTNYHSQNGTMAASSMETTINNLRPLATQVLSLNNTESVPSTLNRTSNNMYCDNGTQIEDDLNVNDNIVIDKLYSLPKRSTPIEITIKITKHVSLPPYKPEEESILKEYTSGDTIHGYCVIENKSNEPIKFEMFYVTLEAYTSVIDKKRGTRTVKRFLRMVDLSASWSYTNIDIASGLRYKCRAKDFDDAVLGLNNNRILEPGIKYKKFFVFKFPKQLLDTTCKQEHFSHCLLPPSFGIDKYRDNCKYSGIRVNHILGCGHLGTKGSPILTNDFCDDELSINYTIDTRIVGKDQKTQKLNIMKEHEYNIRFIPFGFHSPLIGEKNPETQLKNLEILIEERLKVLRTIFDRLNQNEPIKNVDIHGTDLVGTIDDNAELDSDEILARKLDQLHVKNRLDYNDHTQSPYDDIKKFERRENIVEAELKYRIKGKSSSKIGLFSSFLSNSGSSSSSSSSTSLANSVNKSERKNDQNFEDRSTIKEKISSHKNSDKTGMILVGAVIPSRALPYHVPSLLHKTNTFENKSKYAQDNWIKLISLLTDEEKTELNKIKINLTCLQSNNSVGHDPPEIQSINTELVIITVKSENSIPVKLCLNTLLDSNKLSHMKGKFAKYMTQIKLDYENFRKNKTKLNELYNMNRLPSDREQSLNFTNFIPNQLYCNVESLANLQVKIQSHNDIFKKQGEITKFSKKHSSNSPAQGWVKKEPFHYEKEFEIPLQYLPNLTYTLVPSFESCLCCRFYCIRVSIKFHHIGSVSVNIPVNIKNFQA